MSLSNLYELTRRSFRTIDARMNVAGQNVANSDSAGFARRRLISSADSIGTLGFHTRWAGNSPNGTGVSLSSFDRLRDQLLASSANRANGKLEFAGEQHRILSSIEGILPSGEGGLNDALSDFWNAWSDVADNPSEPGVRSSLVSKSQTLARSLNRADTQLQRFEEGLRGEISNHVGDVNSILDRIAELNNIIARSENQNSPNYAAADERDDLVRQLSSLAGIEVQTNHDDGFRISIGGIFVVEGEHATHMTLDNLTNEITFGESDTKYRPETGGRLGAALTSLTSTLPTMHERLDAIASALVNEVNALHSTGFGLDGTTGIDFFDASGTNASSIRVSDAVVANPDSIASSGLLDTPGDSTIAALIAKLQHEALIGTRTLNEDAIDLVGSIGSKISSAAAEASGQASVVAQLDAIEHGISGVSVEDEMTSIIELQQAYAATARVLQAAEQMMNTLLTI